MKYIPCWSGYFEKSLLKCYIKISNLESFY